MSPRPSRRRTLSALALAALTAGGTAAGAATAVPAAAASLDVVISEVYGGGGNSGAPWTNDFIELRNDGTAAVSLSGWSVQYASASGTSWAVTPLTGSIATGGTHLVQEGGGTAGSALPTPDDRGTLALSAANGKVALVRTATALSGCGTSCRTAPDVVDFLGFGAANEAETTATEPLTNTTSAGRGAARDSDVNATDFTVGTPGPRNSAGQTAPPPPPPPPPSDPLPCESPARSIGSVQGRGAASPLAGQVVTVAGTVVGDLQEGGFGGVFVQDGGDGDPATSDGLFAYRATGTLALGDRIVVRGTVTEHAGLTELTGVTVTGCGAGPLPAAAALPPSSSDDEREALEGMLVAPAAALTVSDVYDLNRYGQVLLSSGGRLLTPTEVADPGPAAQQVAAENAARSILLDDGRTATLSTAAGGPPPYLTVEDPVRVGDTAVLGRPVVLTYGFGDWLLEPADGTTDGTTFTATNPRPATPPTVGGDLRVADFNVLNYFVDFPGQYGDAARGATNAAELAQQQTKIVNALAALDADVLTLHEVENSAVLTPGTPYRALETLLAALEAQTGQTWSYVPAHEDTDVITNAIVYRPDVVTPVGDPAAPADLSAFDNARSPVAQTFSASGEVFTVIANHLKSKGSGCGAGSDDTSIGGAGNCNGARVAQAQALVAFADQVARQVGDPDVLLTGDFNSYRFEDPIDLITGAGYTDMAPVLAPGEYSYVFGGGSGSLDHVFATPSMRAKLTGLGVWDVNAVESYAYQYDGYEPLYAGYPYRASDHNPTLIGIDTRTPATATISADRPLRGDEVTVTGSGFAAGEEVTATLPSRARGQLGSAVAGPDGGVAITFTVPRRLPAGDQQVLLTGDSGEAAGTGFSLRPALVDLVLRLVGFHAGG